MLGGGYEMQAVNSDGLKLFVEKVVCINREGPESKKGRLVTVKDDHLVLLTEEQYLYYQTKHIKSITVDSIEPEGTTISLNKKPVYLDATSFKDILEKMSFRRVQINQGGPECVNGVLSRLFENHVDLVQGHEVIKVATPHIKNISYNLSKQDANSNKDSQAEKVAENKTKVLPESTELKEQTTIQSTKQAEVKPKPLAQSRNRSEKKERSLIHEPKPVPIEMPLIQESKPIDPVNILQNQDSDYQDSGFTERDEFTDALPVIADNPSKDTAKQLVGGPVPDISFMENNPVPNYPETMFYNPVVEQTVTKTRKGRSRKSKLFKRNRKTKRPTATKRKRKMIKFKKIKIMKKLLFWRKKRKTWKAVRLRLVWINPIIKMYFPRK
jgi:spore coat protein B